MIKSQGAIRKISMEYIPDGLSKAQWEALKKKDEENIKNKNLGDCYQFLLIVG